MFLRFWLAQIPLQFLHNQLALTKLGKYLPVSIGLTSIVMISTEEGTCTLHAKKFSKSWRSGKRFHKLYEVEKEPTNASKTY